MPADFIELVESAIEMRGEDSVPRDFISEALEKIERGEVEIERYPSGAPMLKAVADLARLLSRTPAVSE